tara:strand:+ start:1840 stop:2127 length:288 start_codon:yes stop_codon:yes gene_type:complete
MKDDSTAKATDQVWIEAQNCELSTWQREGQDGNDWNNWWSSSFDNYSFFNELAHQYLNKFLSLQYQRKLYKVLKRDEGRNPDYHYGTYILIGEKK